MKTQIKTRSERRSRRSFPPSKEWGLQNRAGFDLSYPSLASPPSVTSARKTDSFRLALFTAACMERAGLHTVLALSKNKVGVGGVGFSTAVFWRVRPTI